MTQNELRKNVRMLKALQDISYKELCSYINIKESSMYNWLREQYDLSQTKSSQLEEIINILKE